MDANGRFSINNGILALPAVCICGAQPDDRGFLDIGFDAVEHGVIYICPDCFRNMADVMGYLAPEVKTALESQLSDDQLTIARLQSTIVNLEAILDGFRNLGNVSSFSVTNPRVESSPADEVPVNSESVEQNADGSGTPEDSSSGEGHGDSETDESPILQEPDGVSGTTGFNPESNSDGSSDDSDGISERIGLSL